jgi:hypothetical protein
LPPRAIDAIRSEIAHYCGLGERVIDQTRRRVLEGVQVPENALAWRWGLIETRRGDASSLSLAKRSR